jgi:hypothetical protein
MGVVIHLPRKERVFPTAAIVNTERAADSFTDPA